MACEQKTTAHGRVTEQQIAGMLKAAWEARENAYVIGPTKVGCAVCTPKGEIYAGCNVEHRYRCHDVHAEVNALTSMVSAGARSVVAVAIAAERERFTPCGGCMDWIMQFAVDDQCVIISQSQPDGPVHQFTARDLMPYYPK